MANIFEGTYSGNGLRFGIVVSRFNEFVTKAMLDGALNELRRASVREADLHVVWVPGAYELPVACETLLNTHQMDALVVIGCVIRGETSHYEHIARSVSDSIQKIAISHRLPIGFGVITAESLEQAISRAGGKHGNKGREAACSAVEMAKLFQALKDSGEKEKEFEKLIAEEFKNR